MLERNGISRSIANSEAFWVVTVATEATIRMDVFVESFDVDGEDFVPFVEIVSGVAGIFGDSKA